MITYGDMMRGYALARGLRRLLIAVPVLTPRLSSYWVHWMTPIPAGIARPLIEGLRNEVVVRDDAARQLFPAHPPAGLSTAVRQALAQSGGRPGRDHLVGRAGDAAEGDHAAVCSRCAKA